jgi:hypothetical protein
MAVPGEIGHGNRYTDVSYPLNLRQTKKKVMGSSLTPLQLLLLLASWLMTLHWDAVMSVVKLAHAVPVLLPTFDSPLAVFCRLMRRENKAGRTHTQLAGRKMKVGGRLQTWLLGVCHSIVLGGSCRVENVVDMCSRRLLFIIVFLAQFSGCTDGQIARGQVKPYYYPAIDTGFQKHTKIDL